MSLKIHTIGGFSEVGKNMTVVDMGDDAVMFDCGLHIPSIIKLQEQEEPGTYSRPTEKKLRGFGAIADDTILDKLGIRQKIKAIIPSHAHLDHIGAIPYVGYRYKAPVVGTPFTLAVLKRIMDDDHINIPNKLIPIKPNATFTIKGKKRNYDVEFINMTHSTIQTAMLALHTPDGV
ncbi:MAG: MBL fold metallo-hydrolase, partial [Candidatus Nanoarchaeia archaeon]